MQHVFIVGSKGIPGAYGGYETFVEKLTEHHQNNQNLKYHVACKSTESDEFEYHNAHCFKIKVPNYGPAQAIYYDVKSLKYSCDYIRKHHIEHPIVYILACRIGPFAAHFQRIIHKFSGVVYVNPDGHEWMRAKWSKPIRLYWKISEQMLVKHADLLICDSKVIEKYIQETYAKYNPMTTYIAYGAETRKGILADDDQKLVDWYKGKGLAAKGYYLTVGRFVPENNYEIMIREFMNSKVKRDFALITNVSDKFLEELKVKTGFDKDARIKFVGTVYDQELLIKIRENAFGYFHGHEVGGTNPSLLEALSFTNLNLLLDVGFNRECGEDGALYWSKANGEMAKLIEFADEMSSKDILAFGCKAHQRIKDWYSWEHICSEYIKVLTNIKGSEKYENISNT
jgi:rhamnosyltransferase